MVARGTADSTAPEALDECSHRETERERERARESERARDLVIEEGKPNNMDHDGSRTRA